MAGNVNLEIKIPSRMDPKVPTKTSVHLDEDLSSLLRSMLANDPKKRYNMSQVLHHPFFAREIDLKNYVLNNHLSAKLQNVKDEVRSLKIARGEALGPLLECVVCFCEAHLSAGLQCEGSEKHFICQECLSTYTIHSSTRSLRLLLKDSGSVYCPCAKEIKDREEKFQKNPEDEKERGNVVKIRKINRTCPPYPDSKLAGKVTEEAFQVYLAGKKQILEEKLAREQDLEVRPA